MRIIDEFGVLISSNFPVGVFYIRREGRVHRWKWTERGMKKTRKLKRKKWIKLT